MTLITDIGLLGTAPLFEGGATPEEDLLRLVGSGMVNALQSDDTVLGPTQSVSAMFGGEGNDSIFSQASGDSLFGGNGQPFGASDGNDYLTNNTGLAVFFGEAGNDTISADRTSTISGGLGADYIVTDDLSNLIYGDQPEGLGIDGDNNLGGNDTIILGVGATGLNNRTGGDDSVSGGPGEDYIRAGAQEPSFLFGNQGNDTIVQFPGSTVELNNLGDTILAIINSAQPDTAWGGQGNDYILGTSGAGFWGLGDVGMDTIVNLGSQTRNFVLAGDADPTAEASNSADYILTGGGVGHFFFGNVGNDYIGITHTVGTSTLLGGQNSDTIFGAGTATDAETNINNFVSGDRGADYIFGAFGNSTLQGDNEAGGNGNDVIVLQSGGTNASGNILYGDRVEALGTDIDTMVSGDDTLLSPVGNSDDTLVAMASGRNTLIGGIGNDSIVSMPSMGSIGNTLQGGLGNDTYVFSGGDTIDRDTLGNNVYIGKAGAKNVMVTLAPTDIFSGDGQFIVTGDQNNFLQNPGTAGIRTGSGRDNIIQNYVAGTTSTGAGDDILDLTFIGAGTCTGLVDAGLGNDSIRLGELVTEVGTVLGGVGNDTILSVGSGIAGAVDGGAGDDSLVASSVLSTGVLSGGEGDDTFNVTRLDGGGRITDLGGNALIVPMFVGTNGATNPIATISGGAGADTLGVASSTSVGTSAPALFLDGGEGDDFLQGFSNGPIGTDGMSDTLLGGAGNDTLFGGNDRKGDTLNGGAGNDVFIIFDLGQTGSGPNAGIDGFEGMMAMEQTIPKPAVGSDGVTSNPLTVGTDAMSDVGAELDNEYVDTITGFTVGQDTIVLNIDNFAGFGVGGTAFGTTPVNVFAGNPLNTDILAGVIADKNGADGTAGFDAGTHAIEDDAFGTSFVGGVPDIQELGSVSYNSSTGGLYIGNGTVAVLMAVLPNATGIAGADPNSFLDLRDPFAGDGFVVI